MTNNSKSFEQIYHEKYTGEKLFNNPLFIVEAIGYLKALQQFIPAERWIEEEHSYLLFTLFILKEQGVF